MFVIYPSDGGAINKNNNIIYDMILLPIYNLIKKKKQLKTIHYYNDDDRE